MEGRGNAKVRYKRGAIFIILFMCWFSLSSGEMANALNGADFAIYNDSIAPPGESGVWTDGVTAIKNMLTWMGLTYEEITYKDLNGSTQNFSGLYKIMLFPGGYAYWYNYWINETGKERIRTFINDGRGYFGICAGAFFASDRTLWKGLLYDDAAGYDLDLFPGTATGPINEIADWDTEGYNMATFNFEHESAVLSPYKPTPYTEDILYYGGPYFSSDEGADIEVLSTYGYNGQPAIVAFQYGSGRVVLSGPHPEIEEDSSRDGVTIDREDEMDDNGSDWELVLSILHWLMRVPSVATGSASSVTCNSATLNGTVNPQGLSTSYFFEYGTTASYGSATTEMDVGSGTEEVSASAGVTGLNEQTTYHFRLVATNSGGTSYGDDATFTTTTTPPTVSSTNPANNATDVAVNTTITATFSETMDASTITTDTFLVNDGSHNIAGTVAYSGTIANFTPTVNLDYYTTYTATITTGAKDLASNFLQDDYEWSFTTQSDTDGGNGDGIGCFISGIKGK
jgi:glutamine amidotransferase-like uncharacterized protein